MIKTAIVGIDIDTCIMPEKTNIDDRLGFNHNLNTLMSIDPNIPITAGYHTLKSCESFINGLEIHSCQGSYINIGGAKTINKLFEELDCIFVTWLDMYSSIPFKGGLLNSEVIASLKRYNFDKYFHHNTTVLYCRNFDCLRVLEDLGKFSIDHIEKIC